MLVQIKDPEKGQSNEVTAEVTAEVIYRGPNEEASTEGYLISAMTRKPLGKMLKRSKKAQPHTRTQKCHHPWLLPLMCSKSSLTPFRTLTQKLALSPQGFSLLNNYHYIITRR